MPRAIHFEINSGNPEKVVEFYKKTFDLKITKWDDTQDSWFVNGNTSNEPGLNSSILNRSSNLFSGESEGIAFVCTIDVPDIDEYVRKVIKNGGTIEIPKTTIPGVGIATYCRDVEGNIFAMFTGETGIM